MKKLSLYTFLVLMFCNVGFAKSVSIMIPNTSVEEVKSKLIDTHLDQGYDIGKETDNRIVFEKEVSGLKIRLLMGFLSDDVETFQRDKFNFSKKDNGVKVYYSMELFSGDEIVKLDSDSTLKSNQKWLNVWTGNNF
ncbi:hypothetical protein N9R96_00555 [Candidatus Pelagibacter sp.]|nr:hypothetical protein [Candidatus Pelagibacter sp.]MDA9599982.1 hypothetical protein [Candidatus Pelagibacter sp.]